MNNLKIAKQLPFNVLLKRMVKKILPQKKIDYTTQEFRSTNTSYHLNRILDSTKFKVDINSERIQHYLKHEFNLLGSGWVTRNIEVYGNVHPTHQPITNQITSLIDKDYQLINWQKDVKTGYEYDVTKSFYDQKTPSGVDIKDLWELGRMQHLPQLALAAKNQEFRNQCLDFIAHNPVGMGVQWACAMDVGIRVANMILAYDIFIEDFDKEFNQIFIDSIYQHGQFILNHLEYKEGAAGNHYLFNLVGLLFIANYFTENKEIKSLKQFAESELEKEFFKQFFNDGGNFEGSTTYHCLSAEAMLYGTALMLRSGKKLTVRYNNLLANVAHFIDTIIKPNGEIPQFGDNDSGRLFKLDNEDDNLLNYKSLLAGFSGLGIIEGNNSTTRIIVEQFAESKKLPKNFKPQPSILNTKHTTYNTKHLILKNTETTTINFENITTKKLNSIFYPEFGMYGFKSEEFYLAISAITNPKMHHSWGHVHNDKLSFELQVKGRDLVTDPGSYIYTSNPEQRNLFRSTKAHHGIVVDGVEQNKMIDLFYLEREAKCELIKFDVEEKVITLKASYYGVEHIRKFEILEDKLVITDNCNHLFKVNINQFEGYSPNYGAKQ